MRRIIAIVLAATVCAVCWSQGSPQIAEPTPPAPQPAPQMQSLAKAFEGRWRITQQFAPDEWTPQGGTGYGEEVWRRGPGGFTVMEEAHEHSPSGETFGLAVVWWDKTENAFNGIWCINTNPHGCRLEGPGSMTWDGKQQVVQNEFPRDGKTFIWHEVLTDVTPTSFVQTADIGEKGGPLKRWLTIHATRIADDGTRVPTSVAGMVQTATGQSSAKAEVLAALSERDKAEVAGDETKVEQSMSDDYLQTDVSGNIYDKQRWLNEYYRPEALLLKSGMTRWVMFDRSGIVVRDLGDTFVVAGKMTIKHVGVNPWNPKDVTPPDSPRAPVTFSFTQVWIKRGGAWKLAVLHNAIPTQSHNPIRTERK